MEIRDIIFSRRKELGYSLEHLSKLVGVSKQTVQKWECGKISNMKRSNISALSKALDIPVAVLMGWENDPAPASEKTAAQNSPEIERLISTAKKLSSEKLNTLIQVAESML